MTTRKRRPGAAAHTIAVVLAAAAAKQDLHWLRRLSGRRFDFRLLAAAAQADPDLPAQGWHDLKRLLKIQAVRSGGELRISIQAEGFAALQRVAGRSGRLVSAAGGLDVRFRFDAAGNAFAALESTPAVHAALTQCRLILDEVDPS